MDLTPQLFLFASFLFLLLFGVKFFKVGRKLNFPPSPPRLPIIGHLHLLGTLPHKSLQKLSQTYGPLVLLYLGRAPTLVVTSAEMAKEIMKTQNVAFSNRVQTRAAKRIFYGCQDVAFSPQGEYWGRMRKLCVSQLLSLNMVRSSHSIKEEEVAGLMVKLRSASLDAASVNLGELLLQLSSSIISKCILGTKYEGEDSIRRFGELSRSATEHMGQFCFRDYFPFFGWMDVLTGFEKKLKNISEELDAFLDEVIEGYRSSKGDDDRPDKNCFIEILLQLQKESLMGMDFTQQSFKAILLDMFVGGTDTNSVTMEWAMTELMENPTKMRKAQEEVRGVVGKKYRIDQDDIDRMDYLKSVVKETLRLHPPFPFLLPRESNMSVSLGSYDIPPKTRVFINVWAIQRDPKLWDRPEEFLPERFVDSQIDFKGNDFQFTPFGAGRRICPGMLFGAIQVEYVLAHFLYWFDWKLVGGAGGKDFDMSESYGLVMHKKNHLQLVPVLHSPAFLK